jgi:catechol 2,3-dioxygenase-like lactoylglutathione lyase family enzyme
MKILFVAGFGPIVPDLQASRTFYAEDLGIPFEGDGDYPHTDRLDGVKAFALWSLATAAESCFGASEWPSDVPIPQAWLEFDVDDVAAAAAELEAGGHRLLVSPKTEPWGQTVARLLSPEGLLVGVTHTPWMREMRESTPASADPSPEERDLDA